MIDDDYLNTKYTRARMKQLEDMIKYCKAHDKEFMFVTIPSRLELNVQLMGHEILLQRELDYVATKHQINSYNGYSMFNGTRQDEINDLFIKGDPHWNQEGADIFAEKFAKILLSHK